ncbi:MAG TPA: hypothetical protein VFD32_06105 [Dehalococcoidia bacterium]|nr:hypothetical protein [Dehalococcoidia bacterium]
MAPAGGVSGSAPPAEVSVPSATPFVAPAIVAVSPIAGANQTPGPVATPNLVGGSAGSAPAAGAGAFVAAAQPAAAQGHGPSTGVLVVLLLGILAIGVLILGGAVALWRQSVEARGTETARTRRL